MVGMIAVYEDSSREGAKGHCKFTREKGFIVPKIMYLKRATQTFYIGISEIIMKCFHLIAKHGKWAGTLAQSDCGTIKTSRHIP